MRFALALALLAGCVPPVLVPSGDYACAVDCNVRAEGVTPDFCNAMGAVIQRTNAAFQLPELLAQDARFKNACDLEARWTVRQAQSKYVGPWFMGAHTTCNDRTIWVGSGPPERMLPHELAHVVQSCHPLPPISTFSDTCAAHSNWTAIYATLDEAGLRDGAWPCP